MGGIGLEVTKVVFRGYGAPQSLQKMQDMKLAREEERLRKRQKMEKETKAHELELQREAYEAQQKEVLRNQESRLEHLMKMKASLDLSGDQLASYLLASEQGPPAKVIQIQGASKHDSVHGSFIQLRDSS